MPSASVVGNGPLSPDERRLLRPLLAGLQHTDGTVRDDSVASLCLLLPRLSADDSAIFSFRERGQLAALLLMDNAIEQIQLAEALLEGVRRSGDEEMLEMVERLAAQPVFGARTRRIREQAAQCAPPMAARLADERERRELLRAAGRPDGRGTLLEPAKGSGEGDPRTLLRSVTEIGDNPDTGAYP